MRVTGVNGVPADQAVRRGRTRQVRAAVARTSLGLVMLFVTACTTSANSASSAGSGLDQASPTYAATSAADESAAATSAAEGSATGPAAPVAGVGDEAGQGVSSGSAPAPVVDDRQIIRTATVALQVTVPPGKDDAATSEALTAAASAAAVKVRALAPGTGGYVSASDGGGTTISVTLRVPAASYDAVMNGLAAIGEVTARTEKTDDVTDEMIDVTSRIATMKASVARIRALLTKADKIGDVIAIESELTQREADLESLENRQTALANQVALSTIAVTITATQVTAAAVTQPRRAGGFVSGLSNGWHALLSFATGLGAVLGALLPFLPLIAAAVALAIWIARKRRRPQVTPNGPVDG
jgi:hypothetical protein